jgi:hypothetical protein
LVQVVDSVIIHRMLHSLTIRFLLVFALLFTQMGGLTHGIAHTLAEQSQDQSLPNDKLCDLCASYAQLGSALGSTPVHFDVTLQNFAFQTAPGSTFLSLAFTAFAARAPPCFA